MAIALIFSPKKVCLKKKLGRRVLYSGDENWNFNLNLTIENRLGRDEEETRVL